MSIRKLIIIAAVLIAFFASSAMAWTLKGVTITYIDIDSTGYRIDLLRASDDQHFSKYIADMGDPDLEKTMLSLALLAQANNLTVDVDITDGTIDRIRTYTAP